jgi:hypothetical protein
MEFVQREETTVSASGKLSGIREDAVDDVVDGGSARPVECRGGLRPIAGGETESIN